MGKRRKRQDAEVADSSEVDYSRKQQQHMNLVDAQNNQPNNVAATVKCSNENLQSVTGDIDKFEKLRLKKQRRKELKNAKTQARKNQEAEKEILQNKIATSIAKNNKKKTRSPPQKESFSCKKGVQYQDIMIGKGPIVQDGKKVRVNYVLRVKDSHGKILDSSDGYSFRLGRGEVIEGWDIGVQGMRQGGKRYLTVPPQAGYGSKNIGGGPSAILFFEITVLIMPV